MAGLDETAVEKGDASKEDSEEQTLGQLMKRCNKAREELYSLLANPVVVDITRTKVKENCIAGSDLSLGTSGRGHEWQVHAGHKCQKDERDFTETRGIPYTSIENTRREKMLLCTRKECFQHCLIRLNSYSLRC